ncbi:kinase-interacting protein 1-like [Rutidosis leptorrhynchoides]|uniref:kinase-interacting protein 1-like n=1 Tax=Rutidosis leptorrhynchoides TaxID=125765 RepID=UPI003A99BBF5
MTQKATGNGYSWWWASHIRTKQSKWLEQNLQDMEDKVEHVLNLITKDGDSFARRAEMYYKHRPEVINFVEETVRAYRSLAERYDKLSTELQKANTTIASICPEKVTYEDDDDYTIGPSKAPKRVRKKKTKIPKPPKLPEKGVLNKYSKTVETKVVNDVPKSDLTKDDEVSTLMVDSVLKSCEETLDMLKEKQEKASQTFDEAKQKLESLKHKFNQDQVNNEKSKSKVLTQDDEEEIIESIKGVSKNPQTVTEMAETVDKLVNKMISLETTVSSQTVLTNMLKKETDDLQAQIQTLEAEKTMQKGDNVKSKSNEVNVDDVSWLEMLLNGLEDKDDILLEDYTTILKGYKATMKKLSEEEKRNRGTLSLMKSAIVKRDYKIQLLKQKLQKTCSENEVDMVLAENEDDDIINEPQIVSTLEGKLRMDVDAIFEENLEFWLRFSSAFRQVHKFITQVKEIQDELKKIRVKNSDIKPIYKHIKEINVRLESWLEQGESLKDELKIRSLALTNVEEKIMRALGEGVEEDDIKFSTHHAAKFKSEIMNMKQENNKVNEELQAGLDHAIALKLEIEKTLERLETEFGFTNTRNQTSKGKSSVWKTTMLRSLIFGSKSKKQKASLFACLGHQKKYSAHKGGSN